MSEAAQTHSPNYLRAVVEAAAWRTQLTERDMQSSEAFEVWIASDPDHEAAWRETQATWDFVDELSTTPEMIGARREALARAQRRHRVPWARRLGLNLGVAASLAVLVLVGAAGGGIAWWRGQPEVYQTTLGERRVVPLADGSKVSLDSSSRVKVRYTRGERRLELVSGQARFDVAHDKARPFSVAAGDRTVVATGTAFNIDLVGKTVIVTLIEGRVLVLDAVTAARGPAARFATATPKAAAVLAAGQQLVAASAGPTRVAAVNLDRTTAWESGQLIFDNEPMSLVAARVSRYADRPISVDPAISDLRVSGVFKTGDTKTFLDAVTHFLPVDAVASEDGQTTLLRRRG